MRANVNRKGYDARATGGGGGGQDQARELSVDGVVVVDGGDNVGGLATRGKQRPKEVLWQARAMTVSGKSIQESKEIKEID